MRSRAARCRARARAPAGARRTQPRTSSASSASGTPIAHGDPREPRQPRAQPRAPGAGSRTRQRATRHADDPRRAREQRRAATAPGPCRRDGSGPSHGERRAPRRDPRRDDVELRRRASTGSAYTGSLDAARVARAPARVVAGAERDEHGLRRPSTSISTASIVERGTVRTSPVPRSMRANLPSHASSSRMWNVPSATSRGRIAERRRAVLRDHPAHVEPAQALRRRVLDALAQQQIRLRPEVEATAARSRRSGGSARACRSRTSRAPTRRGRARPRAPRAHARELRAARADRAASTCALVGRALRRRAPRAPAASRTARRR